MKIDIITALPKMFAGPLEESIVGRARQKKLVEINVHDLRKWSNDRRKTVDDKPFGGGAGMILMVEPIDKAVDELKTNNSKVILLAPQGKPLNQEIVEELSSKESHLILICGHYEGVDERVRDYIANEEISIGDYVLTGGELPAMVLTDAITRQLPGVLKKEGVAQKESFSIFGTDDKQQRLLEYPQYTRPAVYKKWRVPEVLLGGNHKEIESWKTSQSIDRTARLRPDLIKPTKLKR